MGGCITYPLGAWDVGQSNGVPQSSSSHPSPCPSSCCSVLGREIEVVVREAPSFYVLSDLAKEPGAVGRRGGGGRRRWEEGGGRGRRRREGCVGPEGEEEGAEVLGGGKAGVGVLGGGL